MKLKGILIIGVIVLGVLIYYSTFVIDERQQVVITQFGRIVGEPISDPGLKFKLPYRTANFFPKNIQAWDGDPGQIPTLDKTFIWVDSFARWKIVDPKRFLLTVKDERIAEMRLDDILDPAVRNFITSNRLIEAVRRSNRELDIREVGIPLEDTTPTSLYTISVGREKITRGILEQAQPKLAKFGIELVDVKIKRINYVEEVRKSVYNRMIAERKQIAEKFRSEGKGEAQNILGDKDKDLQEIVSGAYKEAQTIKGKADAEATKIYAEAYGMDPEFYSFMRTLDIYKESLDEKNTLILSTDSEFLKYLKGYDQ
jgi:membrane protease subunit HflC